MPVMTEFRTPYLKDGERWVRNGEHGIGCARIRADLISVEPLADGGRLLRCSRGDQVEGLSFYLDREAAAILAQLLTAPAAA